MRMFEAIGPAMGAGLLVLRDQKLFIRRLVIIFRLVGVDRLPGRCIKERLIYTKWRMCFAEF
jgi:hypothetical protein